jgi:hypothetical protein
MKLITLTNDLTFKHLYIPGLHKDIPDDAISVTNAVFIELSQNPHTKRYNPDSKLAEEYTKDFNFFHAFNSKFNEVISLYKQAMSPIKANYTDEDIASFPTQEAEAKAWDADNSAGTPLLDYMLANRPTVDKATLVSRILQNAFVYKQIAGPAIGKKQYLEDQLYDLKIQHEDPEQPDVTQADFDAIVVDFS